MKRYRAQEGITPLTSHVMDTEAEPFTKPLASTRTLKDAEDIAAALNHHQGAVDRIEDLEQALELLRGHVGTIGAAIIDTALSTSRQS
jgi:hypothetical protein